MKKLIVVIVLLFAGCFNLTLKPYTNSLKEVDKVEVFKLKKVGDVWKGEIENQKTLVKGEAESVAKLWRQQSFFTESAICHNPSYSIKFYSQDRLIVYATLCWDCDNIKFLTPKIEDYVSFDSGSIKGQQFLNTLEQHLSHKD